MPSDLQDLWKRFENPEVHPLGWNHQAIVKIAVAALLQFGDEALPRIRQGLQRLNAANLRGMLGSDGYHETLTRVWLRLVKLAMQAEGATDRVDSESLGRVLARLCDSKLPLRFYSTQHLGSEQARREWVEPDLGEIELHPPLPPALKALWLAFLNKSIPAAEWTHEAHLRVALAAHIQYGPQASEQMRIGIQNLNEAHGVPQTQNGGYHETLTQVWCKLVAQACPATWAEKDLQEYLERLRDKRLPLQFYSRDRLLSWEARCGWVEPDLGPISLATTELTAADR